MFCARCVLTMGSTFRTLASMGEYLDIFLDAILQAVVFELYEADLLSKYRHLLSKEERKKHDLCRYTIRMQCNDVKMPCMYWGNPRLQKKGILYTLRRGH